MHRPFCTQRLLPRLLIVVLLLAAAPVMAAPPQQGGAASCNMQYQGLIDNTNWFNQWSLKLTEEIQVTVTMTATSGDLDPYLSVLDAGNNEVAANDDTDGLNSMVSVLLPAGAYIIDASRFDFANGASTGGYILDISCGGPPPAATGGTTEVYFDDFSSQGRWRTGSSDNGEVWYENEELHILNYTDAQFTEHSQPEMDFGDFVWSVDVRMVEGALDNWFYFGFRYIDPGNYYRVGFSADGWYMGEARVGDDVVEEWAAPTQSPVIRQGHGATNTVRIEAIGDQISYYLNDVLLIETTVAPQNLIASGDISMAVASMSGDSFSEGAFDNLVVEPIGATAALFTENFDGQVDSSWLLSDDFGDASVVNGELRILDVPNDSAAFAIDGFGPFGDMVLEVDSRWVDGTDDNWHFISFRSSEDGLTYYRVGYSADGYYVFSMFVNDQHNNLVEPTLSDAIIIGQGATNSLRIENVGAQVRFWINDVLVVDEMAPQTLPPGLIRFGANSLDDSTTTVAFDNIVVREP